MKKQKMKKQNKALTLTVIANMTSNYGEGLGNIGSIQKVYKNGKTYAIRSRESMKNAIMVQSGLYEDLKVDLDKKVNQKTVSEEKNAATVRALEGGYMNTSGGTKIRKSSFYLTDAVSFHPFVNDTRFHNNLYLAQTYAKQNNLSLQDNPKETGLMPYQYEYDRSLKKYSITIDLDRVGVDENYGEEAEKEEKTERVNLLLDAISTLSLVVRGNLDNAEPVFVVGGIGKYKTHYFDNVVSVENEKLRIVPDLTEKLEEGYAAALIEGSSFSNEKEIADQLKTVSVNEFFRKLKEKVKAYYESSED